MPQASRALLADHGWPRQFPRGTDWPSAIVEGDPQSGELTEWLAQLLDNLPGGVLVMNIFGGPAVASASTIEHRVTPTPRHPQERPIAPFRYRWQQGAMTPVDSRIECLIHFHFDDGPPIENAFVYDWRLWSPAELIEALAECGFAPAQLWRHTHDPARGAAGVFLGPVPSFDPPPLWTAYVVARG